MTRGLLLAGAVFALLGVVAGALGSHALEPILDTQARTWYELAVRYQMMHALALLLVGVLELATQHRRWWRMAGICWIIGILLFSGSLYGLSLGAPTWIGAITPIGGLSLTLGWFCLLVGVLFLRPSA